MGLRLSSVVGRGLSVASVVGSQWGRHGAGGWSRLSACVGREAHLRGCGSLGQPGLRPSSTAPEITSACGQSHEHGVDMIMNDMYACIVKEAIEGFKGL